MKSYRLAGLVILIAGATAGVIAALIVGGAAVPPKLLDPGPVVMWGLPIVKMIANLAGAAMLGRRVDDVPRCMLQRSSVP